MSQLIILIDLSNSEAILIRIEYFILIKIEYIKIDCK